MEENNSKTKRLAVIICICVALAAAAVIGILMIREHSRKENYQAFAEQGQRYMEQEDYENAVAQFELALEENPNSETAYVDLYNALMGAGYNIRAQLLLEQGIEKLESPLLELLLNRLLEDKESSPEGEQAALTEEERQARSADTALDISALQKFRSNTYRDYEKTYGQGTVTAENGGCTVVYSGVDAVFRYDADSMDRQGRAPEESAAPKSIEIGDLGLIFRNFQDVLLYERLCTVVGRIVSVSTGENGSELSFTYRELEIRLTCDENGNLDGEDTCVLLPPEGAGDAGQQMEGAVIDAVTGEGISGAEIRLTSKDTGKEHEGESERDGSYSIEIPNGDYEIEITCDGYIDFEDEITVEDGEADSGQEFILSPELSEGEIRIVLTWGSNPRDLDSHLVADSLGGRNHLYFGQKKITNGGKTVAELDLDDTNGFGPETTTIYDAGGSYYFGVHHFSGMGSLSSSGAEVTIYLPGQSPVTVQAPQGSGYFWSVCRIENGQVTLIDEITEQIPDWWD